MSDDDLIRRGDVLREIANEGLHILDAAIAALPARGVGVLDKTLIAKKADDAREVFDGTCDTAKQAVDYFEQLLLAAITEAGQ